MTTAAPAVLGPAIDPGDDIMIRSSALLQPDPERVVIRPFMPADDAPPYLVAGCSRRPQRIADRIFSLDAGGLRDEYRRMVEPLAGRHRGLEAVLMRRFHEVNGLVIDP